MFATTGFDGTGSGGTTTACRSWSGAAWRPTDTITCCTRRASNSSAPRLCVVDRLLACLFPVGVRSLTLLCAAATAAPAVCGSVAEQPCGVRAQILPADASQPALQRAEGGSLHCPLTRCRTHPLTACQPCRCCALIHGRQKARSLAASSALSAPTGLLPAVARARLLSPPSTGTAATLVSFGVVLLFLSVAGVLLFLFVAGAVVGTLRWLLAEC
jgi:hypothetical protein